MLDGISNFNSWKTILLFIMEDSDLESHLQNEPPEVGDDESKAKYKKEESRAKRIIIDSVKDHLVTHISIMGSTKKMFYALVELYESNNTNRQMALRDELRSIKMTSEDSVSSYFLKISRVKDQLAAIDDPINKRELVNIVLKGFPPSWESFIQGICAREKLP